METTIEVSEKESGKTSAKERFDQLLLTLYQGCNSSAGFIDFVHAIKDRYYLSGVAISAVHSTSQQISKVWVAGLPDELIEWYLEDNRMHRDPMRQRLTHRNLDRFDVISHESGGKPIEEAMVVGEFSYLLESRRLIDVAGLNIYTTADETMALYLHRSEGQGQFSAQDIKELNRLVPHIRQAVELYRGLYDKQVENMGLSQALNAIDKPLLIVNQFLEVCFANNAAKQTISKADEIALINKTLTFTNPDVYHQLGRYLHSVFTHKVDIQAEPVITIERDEMPALRLVLSPISAEDNTEFCHCVMVQILSSETSSVPTAEKISLMMGLTKAEARVCEGLCAGLSIKEVADKLSRQESTVRSNLKSAFLKTGHHSQPQLVAAIYRCCL